MNSKLKKIGKVKIKKTNNITLEHSCMIRTVYQLCGVKGKRLLDMFPQYSKARIYVHAKKPLNGDTCVDKRKHNKGRPRKISARDERLIIRNLFTLRETRGSFTSSKIQVESSLSHLSNRTFRRTLNNSGFYYLQSRKKGLLSPKDIKRRLQFCRKQRRDNITQEFWDYGISFYLDGKGFEYKSNPMDQARAPKSREWRRKGEGLNIGCVAKGKKEGARNANFMVAISRGKGVVMCTQYFGQITGEMFKDMVNTHFPTAFKNSSNPTDKLFLMDGCPRQNAKVALNAIKKMGASVFRIPARSADLNPIENFFHLVSKKLQKDALEKNITHETFEKFSTRVECTMLKYPRKDIDNIIGSMDKRIGLVIKAKGQRIKY